MRPIVLQLHDAFVASGLGVAELLSMTGLSMDRTSLAKKLKGEIRLNTDEAQAIAIALDVPIVWARPARKRRMKAA